ncbi:xanthine dehydrogenase family protein subunit M [Euhalothece natronophila Z-M001]|uniref:Xanthine dehydrogenase family protein subunit M n=1 Tax=Euhalothece natronophila Z-M001 TaxID=522448 RepID=A0A5B8NI48_9CHRO|nr:xanthine dehydrogenase family protein subunit M [Euhalothece natronophila]QDZ38644.1 xanthine dehydrogenase family protein subunit M [Euhalothece natronophila Z-M001]
MKQFGYVRAHSTQEAVQNAIAQQDSLYIAGGTNVVDRLKAFLDEPSRLIDVSRLDLNQIESTSDGGVKIGALVTNTAVANHPRIRQDYPLLSRAILSGASQQIRNVATVGGNLLQRTRCPYYYDTAFACNKRQPHSGCSAREGINRMHAILGASEHCIAVHPSDMAVALTALDAVVEVEGSNGVREIPVSQFHRLPGETPQWDSHLEVGELITAVKLPPHPTAKTGVYLKLRDRASFSFALVSVAAMVSVTNNVIQKAYLALGGVAHKPWRLWETEAYLQGKSADAETWQQATEMALQDAQPLSHNHFKVDLSKRAMERALKLSAERGSET